MEKPQAPNPYASSMLQSQFNTQAAQQQQKMNMVNQKTPWGSLTYSPDPNSPGGYTATQEYSPEVQNLVSSNLRNSQGSSDIEGTLLNNSRDAMAKPLDLSWDATASNIAALNKKSLDPLWQERQNSFDQQMAQRGLVPGSAAYDAAARDFNNSRDNSYNDMLLRAHQQSVSDLTQQYNSPFNALASLRSGSQIGSQPSMGFSTTPQESVQAPNYMGAEQNAYQSQMQQYNSGMGGLFGLGGTLAGAALGGPFGLGGSMGSLASQLAYAPTFMSSPGAFQLS